MNKKKKEALNDIAEKEFSDFFECRCGSEIIKIERYYWDDGNVDEVFFGMFKHAYKPSRWFYIKQILKNGSPHLDSIIFDYGGICRLKKHIDKIAKLMKENKLSRKKPERPTGKVVTEGKSGVKKKIITFPKRFTDEVKKINEKK